jgi:hypothetical protein
MLKPVKKGYTVVLVSKSWNRKVTLKLRGHHQTKAGAKAIVDALHKKCFGNNPGDYRSTVSYRICGPRQLTSLINWCCGANWCKEQQTARRKAGAEKAKKTIKQNGGKIFITCPACKAKSKKLYSEMGGLQTRKCKNGHYFEIDMFMGMFADMTKKLIPMRY